MKSDPASLERIELWRVEGILRNSLDKVVRPSLGGKNHWIHLMNQFYGPIPILIDALAESLEEN